MSFLIRHTQNADGSQNGTFLLEITNSETKSPNSETKWPYCCHCNSLMHVIIFELLKT